MECTPFQQILQITLNNVQKLLRDHRMPNQDNTLYDDSQFRHLYDNPDPPDPTVAYGEGVADDPDGSSRANYKDQADADDIRDGNFYPLTESETLELQHLRVLEYIQIGFVPIEDLEKIECTSLFIANATDRQRIEPADTTLNQVQEVIPLNFRLMTKQPDAHKLEDTNIVVVDKVLEGLKYVLDRDDYINLTFERRGFNQDTVIRSIDFVQALNLEEFLSPYEVVDYLFQITVREQWSR